MSKHVRLFTPGPGDVDETVLKALSRPVIRHYGADWMELYNQTIQLLRHFYQTKNDLFIVPGPASALLDMAIGSLVPTGGKIIVGSNGFFGDRLIDIATAYGAEVIPFNAPLGQPLDPSELDSMLKTHPDVEVVALVHHETSTTVMNPLLDLAKVTRTAGKVLIVDAVASLGGVELPVDDWGVDVCVTAANKCLESIPGIGFISVSKPAWKLVDKYPRKAHGWYNNLATWRTYVAEWGDWHPSPVTTPSSNLLAVLTSMIRIMERGLVTHYLRYKRASLIVREVLQNLGFEMFVPRSHASPIVTAVKAHPKFSISEMSTWLEQEKNIAIGGALGELSGRIFRIGHLGKAADSEYILALISAFEDFLQSKGLTDYPGIDLADLEKTFPGE